MALIGSVDISLGLDTKNFNANVKAAAKSLETIPGMTKKTAGALAGLSLGLKKEAAEFGLSGNALKIYRLELAGVPPQVLRQVKALDKHIQKLKDEEKELEKAKAAAKAYFDGTRTSAEKYRKTLADLQSLQKKGLIDKTTFTRGKKQARADRGYGIGDRLGGLGGRAEKAVNVARGVGKVVQVGAKGVGAVGKGVGAVGGAVGKVGGGIAHAGGAALGAGLGIVKDVMGGIVGVATAAASALTYLGASAIKAMAASGDLAKSLRVSSEDLTTLEFVAKNSGGSVEGLRGALATLGQSLGPGKAVGDDTINGLNALGLSVKDIRALNPADQFRKIAAGIATLKDPAEQAAVATQLFGEAGLAMLPTLTTGSAGMDALAAKANELGVVLSSTDTTSAKEVDLAFGTIGDTIQGVVNHLTVSLAPAIKVAADRFLNLVTQAKGLVQGIDPIESLAKGAALVADIVQTVGIGFKGMQAVASTAIGWVISKIGSLAKTIEDMVNKIPGVHIEISSTLKAIGKDVSDLGTKQFAEMTAKMIAPNASTKVKAYFGDFKKEAAGAAKAIEVKAKADTKEVKAKADTKGGVTGDALGTNIKALERSLRMQISAVKLTLDSESAEIKKLRELGATDAQLANAIKLNRQKNLKEQAKGVIEQSMTPLQTFQKKIGEVQEMVRSGYLSQQQGDQEAFKLRKEVGGETKFVGAADSNSKEARSQLLAANSQGSQMMARGITNVSTNTASMVGLLNSINNNLQGGRKQPAKVADF